jgi:arylsulfatase
VLVVLVDALRADHLGCYGYPRPTSPTIDSLAARGVVFERAHSQAPWTKPSVASLLTGTYPIQHGVFTGSAGDTPGHITSDVLADELLTMAEAFKGAGYATAAFVHNAQISSFMGFDQGFDIYAENLGDAASLTSRFLEWLEAETRRPFFAYLHYLDPHWPYTPPDSLRQLFPVPEGTRQDFNTVNWKIFEREIREGIVQLTPRDAEAMAALYDGEIRFVDSQLARLLDRLGTTGEGERTVLVLTADHGEEFLDHGGVGHGQTLYEEVLHVPLLIVGPETPATRVPDPVETVDILPTLLELTGQEIPEGLPGRPLRPLWEGREDWAERATYADHRPGGDRGPLLQSVVQGRWKLIRSMRLHPVGADTGQAPPPWPVVPEGMWVEADGMMDEEGRFLVLDLEPLGEERREWRLVGVLEAFDPETGRLRLLGRDGRLKPGGKVRDANGERMDWEELEPGRWVKAKVPEVREGLLWVRRIQVLDDPQDWEPEIKAPVDRVLETGPEELVLELAGGEAVVDRETDFQGEWTWPPVEPPPPPREIRRELVRLELYDLFADPEEREDLAGTEPAQVRRLLRLLDAWEGTWGTAPRAGRRVVLDPATEERLRSLGYIR